MRVASNVAGGMYLYNINNYSMAAERNREASARERQWGIGIDAWRGVGAGAR